MHRIRVGLTGLACVFLVVMLAAVVLRMTGVIPKSDTPPANSAAPNEPLAQLGVAPGTPENSIAPVNGRARPNK
jgi:hypothetical protein